MRRTSHVLPADDTGNKWKIRSVPEARLEIPLFRPDHVPDEHNARWSSCTAIRTIVNRKTINQSQHGRFVFSQYLLLKISNNKFIYSPLALALEKEKDKDANKRHTMSHPPDHIPDLDSPRQSRSPIKKEKKEKVSECGWAPWIYRLQKIISINLYNN